MTGFMKKFLLGAAVVSLLSPAAIYAADPGHHHHQATAAEPAPSGGNPLKEEMIKLDAAFKEIVSAVSIGDGERVHKAIETLHGAKEKTQESLHTGAIKPPKNANKMHLFEKMDNEFHERLESLASVAQKNDQKKMLALTKKLLDSCVGCHNTFRK